MRASASLLLLLAACAPAAPRQAPASAPAASTPAASAPEAAPSPPCLEAAELRTRASGLLSAGRLRRALGALDAASARCPASAPQGQPAQLRVVAELGLLDRAHELLPRVEALKTTESHEAVAAARGWIDRSAPAFDSPGSRAAFDRAWEEAREAASRGLWQAARDGYLQAWQHRHPAPEALVKAAEAAREGGQLAEARRLADRAMIELERSHGAPSAEASAGLCDARLLALSPDGRQLAVVDRTQVTLFDRASGAFWRALEGHTKQIESIVYSPDGKVIMTAGRDQTLRRWDASTGEQLDQVKGSGWNEFLLYAPDGKTLVSSTWDRTIELRDAATLEVRSTIKGLPENATGAVFSADGARLHVSAKDGSVSLWEVATGKLLRGVLGRLEGVNALQFSPDARTLALGGIYRSLRLWDVAAGRQLAILDENNFGGQRIAYTPDGKALAAASGGYEQGVKLWDVASGSLRASFALPEKHLSVSSVAVSPDGKALFAGFGDSLSRSKNGPVYEWEIGSGKLVRGYLRGTARVNDIALDPGGKLVAAGGDDGLVRVWQPGPGARLTSLQGSGPAASVAFSPDGKLVASGELDGVRLWEVATGKLLHALKHPISHDRQVMFTPDGKVLASMARDGVVSLWSVEQGTRLHAIETRAERRPVARFSPDGRTLFAASSERNLQRWEVSSGKALGVLQGHTDQPTELAFAPDGKTLVSAGKDGQVIAWEATTGKRLQSFLLGARAVTGLLFSPDGAVLVASIDREPGWLLELGAGKTRRLREEIVVPLAFSPDGQTFVASSRRGQVHRWGVAEGKPLLQLRSDGPGRAILAPDGKTMLSTGGSAVDLWNLSTGAAITTLSALRGRSGGYALSGGGVELVGEQRPEDREQLRCRVGRRLYPFWLCEDQLTDRGEQAAP